MRLTDEQRALCEDALRDHRGTEVADQAKVLLGLDDAERDLEQVPAVIEQLLASPPTLGDRIENVNKAVRAFVRALRRAITGWDF